MQLVKQKLEKTFLGSGTTLIKDLEQLDKYDAYALPSSPTYRSLTHYESASIVRELITDQGLHITDQVFGISKSYHQLYGTFTLATSAKTDHNLKSTVIIRNSIDKSLSFKVAVGAVNMICSNGIMSSSIFADKSGKHGKNADPQATASEVINNYLPTFERLTAQLDTLKSEYLTDYEGRKQLMKCCRLACFNPADIMQVWDEYNNPSFEQFNEKTSYNLLMAVTHQLKETRTLGTLMNYYKQTAEAFNL